MRLREYPLFELRPRTSSRSRFVLRTEESISTPLDGSKLKLYRNPLVTLKNVSLSFISTEKRNLGYEVYFRQQGGMPKIIASTWYVLAFYGTRMTSANVLYQDHNVRLVRAGNGNCFALIVRREVNKEDEVLLDPVEDKASTNG